MKPPVNRPAQTWRSRSIFGVLGLRPTASEHSAAEGALLRKYAAGAKTIVEIGVAEGASGWEMRTVMAADGTIYLIDPYHLSKLGRLGPAALIARRQVASASRGTARWITEFSPAPAVGWTTPIDFLFIDGDHGYPGVKADWNEWTAHLAPGGSVALHDAREEAPWTDDQSGPVQLLRELRDEPNWNVIDEVDSLAVLRRAGC